MDIHAWIMSIASKGDSSEMTTFEPFYVCILDQTENILQAAFSKKRYIDIYAGG